MARVTLKDIAEKLNFSVSYTARAFKGRPGIPASACEQVREMAEKLGYRPDPFLAGLAAYRQSRKPAVYQGTLAFVTVKYDEQRWLATPETGDLLRGARARAEALGYRVEYFNVSGDGAARRHTLKMFQTRGIRGAVVRALPFEVGRGALPLDDFPAVWLFGEPWLDGATTVASNHGQSMELALQKLRERGCRRPALILSTALSAFLHHGWGKSFAACAAQFERVFTWRPPSLEIDPLMLTRNLRRDKPDALLFCISENFIPPLTVMRSGKLKPAVVCMDLLNPQCGFSGIWQNRPRGGAAAMNWLHGTLLTAQAGVAAEASAIMIPGIWKDGNKI